MVVHHKRPPSVIALDLKQLCRPALIAPTPQAVFPPTALLWTDKDAVKEWVARGHAGRRAFCSRLS